ncbi:hypothetical protein L228DRAFT_98549 [Xylona heveae TC161]|uniref:Involucrin repeat protein n=1 Tax=Xylona heveae (strain CBS 132557 / TC161) TaxID=1328760 RepID=A0A165I890_XYLHT|nr:hypothetical protein L228DRAFT_98549 [Xylona heveae TC161]KZF24525.1 hypothetical protein L228DRAFT_98549 [Xylona heveae TC161]
MWSRLLGRSPSSRSLRDRDEEISQVGKRSTHSSSRHRSGSVVSSPSAYKPSRSDDRGHSRSASATVPRSRSSYYSPESPSIASYATAPSNRVDRETRRDRSSSGLSKNTSRIESRGGSYYAVRSAKSGRRSERSPSRERRQHRRERSRSPARIQELQWQSRDRLKRGLGEDDRERGMSSIDYAESRAPNAAGYEYMTAYEEPAVTSSPAQQSIPAPSTHTYSQLSSHITDQFPGQDPAQYAAPYRPPLSFAEGGPGLAADYYGDHGESVAEQPGVRPQPPSLIVGAQPHLQAASPLSAPPIEPSALGGVGAAADFFNDGANLQSLRPTSSTPVSSSNRPTRPSKPTPPSMSGSAAAALTGSAGYAASNLAHSASHHAGSSSFNDEVSYSQGPAPPNMYSTVSSAPPGASPTVHHSSSAPAIPTLGAAAAGAATGYYLGHHSSHSHGNSQSGMNAAGYTSTSQPSQSQPVYSVPDAQRPSKPPRPGQLSYAATTPIYGSTALGMAGSAGSGNVALNGYSHGAMALQTRRKGPLEKFVEFWKDREGVAQYEEYTEYIGVCKDCFEPGTTARDAPRKHHYRRRKSNDRPGSRGKVDKERRYGLSDSEQSRRGKKSSLAAGLAGYGLGQASQTFAKQKRGFEDTYSVRSGKRTESAAFPSSDSRYGSQPRRDSSQSYGFYAPIGSNSPQRHRSRSRSPDRRNRVLQSGVAADFPPSVPGAFDSNDSSYPTSRREYVRSNRQSPSRMSGLASLFGLASSKASRNRRHRSPTPDSKYLKKSQAAGIVEGSVTKPFSRPGRSRKSKSFFNFGNSSSSSSASSSSADMGLAYGGGLSKSSRQGPRHANKAFNDDAAMIGLGVAAASVLSKRGKKNKADTRGDVPRKGSQLSSSDDAWESVSEAESSSVSSALAFGGASDSGSNGPRRHRKSSDSERSGISNWKWMFGGKRRTPSSASVDRPAQRPPKAGPIELRDSANSPTAPPLNYRQGAVPSYNARVPDMQYVVPVPTSDPSRFDVRRSDSVISSQTVNRSARPEPVPIQHTQPIVAVAPEKLSNFVESTLQGSTYEAPESATTAPTIHRKPYVEYRATGTENRERRTPVDPFQYLVQDSVPVENDQEVKVPTTRRRRASSPTFGSTDRDLASGQRAGVASYSDFQPRRVKPESRKPSLQRFQNNEKSQGRRQSSATTRTNEVFAAPLDDGNPQIVEIRPGRQNEPRHSSSDTPVSVNAAPSNPGPFVSSKENESSSDSRSHGQPQVELEQFRPEASPEGESPRSEYARSSRHPGDYVPDYHPLSDREAQAYVDSVMDKYNEEPQPVAAYFAPPELLSRKSDSPQSPDPNGDSNVTSSRVPQIVTIAPPVDHENDNDALQHAQFAGSYPYGALPWIVPRLNLIEPSPPPSTIGSTRDDRSAPISPVETKPNSSTGPEKSSESRVSWGDLQTKEYIVESSEEEPQKDDGDYHGHSSNQSTDESPEIHAHEYESHPVPESSSSGDLPQHVPGAFGEDVEFAATVAAGLEDSGFDPAIVIDDNNFRHRKSPPASHDFRFYHAPYAETVTDLGLDSPGTEGAPPRVGYVEGEVETPGTVTPVETKMHPKEISRSPSPTEEERAGSSARQLGAEREGDEFDRDSDRDSSDPERKVREIRPDVSTSSDKGAFEPGIESQIFENEKAQRHRNRNAQEFEAQISDSPVYETRSEVGKPPSNSKGSTSLRRRSWGPETQTAKSQRSRSQDSSPRELGRSNERFDDTPGFDMQIGTRRSSSSDIGVNPRSSGSQSIVSIPSNAFDDVEELADVKRPRKTKRASSRFGHRVPGSPLRSELAFRDDSSGSEQDAGEPNDLVRDAVVDDTEFTAQVPLPHELDEDAEELSGSTVREPEADVASAVFKRRGSFSSWGEAQDQPFEAPEEDKFYGWSDEELSKPRKRSSHRSRSRGKMEDESRLDGSRSSRASERPDSSASVHRSRSRGSNLEESSERTHRKRRSRRSSDVFGSPKPLTRSMSMSETEHRGHDDSHGSKRKSKRSSLDYNDLASVTSLPARLDDDKGSKREKRGGLFSFLTGRRSVDSLPALERSREIRSEELKPKSKRGSKEEEIGRDPYDIGDDAARSATSLPELSQKPSLEEESRESSSASGKKKKKKKHRHSSDIGTGTKSSRR